MMDLWLLCWITRGWLHWNALVHWFQFHAFGPTWIHLAHFADILHPWQSVSNAKSSFLKCSMSDGQSPRGQVLRVDQCVVLCVVLSHHAVVSFPSAYRHLPQLVPLPRHWHHPRRNIKQRPTKIILKKSSKLHKSMQISTWICRSKMATILDLASTTASLALAMARSWSLDQLESCFDRSKPLVWSKWFIDDHGSSWSVLVYCVIDSLNFDQVVRLSMSQVLCTELPRFFSFRLNQTIKKWSRPRLTKM